VKQLNKLLINLSIRRRVTFRTIKQYISRLENSSNVGVSDAAIRRTAVRWIAWELRQRHRRHFLRRQFATRRQINWLVPLGNKPAFVGHRVFSIYRVAQKSQPLPYEQKIVLNRIKTREW